MTHEVRSAVGRLRNDRDDSRTKLMDMMDLVLEVPVGYIMIIGVPSTIVSSFWRRDCGTNLNNNM